MDQIYSMNTHGSMRLDIEVKTCVYCKRFFMLGGDYENEDLKPKYMSYDNELFEHHCKRKVKKWRS
jgi:hypothetical protein